MTCNSIVDIAATHTSNALKTQVTLKWMAPVLSTGSNKTVVFTFSVVQAYFTYWANEEATNTLVVKADSTPMNGTFTLKSTALPEG
jgi:hypothetical protein